MRRAGRAGVARAFLRPQAGQLRGRQLAQVSQLGQQLQEAEEPAKPLRLDAPAARRVRRG